MIWDMRSSCGIWVSKLKVWNDAIGLNWSDLSRSLREWKDKMKYKIGYLPCVKNEERFQVFIVVAWD
jgi:hypothetical protein